MSTDSKQTIANIDDLIPSLSNNLFSCSKSIIKEEKDVKDVKNAKKSYEFPEEKLDQTRMGTWAINTDAHFWISIEPLGRLDHDHFFISSLSPFMALGGNVIEIGSYIGCHTASYLKRVM